MSTSSQHDQRQAPEETIGYACGPLQDEPENITEGGADTKWLKHNILSLDGGGIRGIWSLLALEQLMKIIAEIEIERDSKIYHSFYPQNWPPNVSQVPLSKDEKTRMSDCENEEGKARVLPPARRYLPCHYFDSFCGSSTGALIAIMLGRFRMTVPDCLEEYKNLGQMIFGNPRPLTPMKFGLGHRYKYNAKNLEKVFKEVTKRRNEISDGEHLENITFPTGEGVSTIFVTTKTSNDIGVSGSPYLIRSYDHKSRTKTNDSSTPTPKGRRNYGSAQKFEVWQVARAATAAPLFFEPLTIPKARGSGDILFTDGGFSQYNNPTGKALEEIEDMYGIDSIGILVSVGTARKEEKQSWSRLRRFCSALPAFVRVLVQETSETEGVHDDVQRISTAKDIPYYRLNHPDGLSVDFDQWEPKHPWFSKKTPGSKTLDAISSGFDKWAKEPETHRKFRRCAEYLVDCRKQRSDTVRWERFATVARYRCERQGCGAREFLDRDKFSEHLSRCQREKARDNLDDEIALCREQWQYPDLSQA